MWSSFSFNGFIELKMGQVNHMHVIDHVIVAHWVQLHALCPYNVIIKHYIIIMDTVCTWTSLPLGNEYSLVVKGGYK